MTKASFSCARTCEDAVFSYQPGWTPATDAAADVEFRNEGMHIRSTGANIGAVAGHRSIR